MQEKERIPFIDYLRVIACFWVMLVHASENFYGAGSDGLAGYQSILLTEANRFWVAFYDGGVARSCVPLFMIASAFLLVPVRTDMHSFYRRRLMRVVPPMIIFLVLYTFLPLAWGGMTWEASMADLRLLPWNFTSMCGHLWFLYPLIGLYLIMPVVSPWLEKATAKEERTFIYLFLISTFLPFIHRFVYAEVWGECFWNGFGTLWYVSGYLGYLVLAHYIRVHLTWNHSKRLRIGAFCYLVGSAFTAWAFWWRSEVGVFVATPDIEWAWEFCTPNVVMATFGAFLLLTCIPSTHRVPALVSDIAKKSFGMYLMHMFFLSNIAEALIQGNPAAPVLPVWITIPIIAVCSYICCYVTTKVLSYLPGSKYFVGC